MFLSNVKFNVLALITDPGTNIQYLNSSPDLSNMEGTLTRVRHDNESNVREGKPLERHHTHMLTVKTTYSSRAALDTGAVIEVTHEKHPITKAWVAVSPVKGYIVQFAEGVDLVGPWVQLHLVTKDQV